MHFFSEHQPISIHALREEGDVARFLADRAGELISIHALREEGDRSSQTCWPMQAANFYPRPPRGGRPKGSMIVPPCGQFLSTPSARRATPWSGLSYGLHHISIHALREEGDVTRLSSVGAARNFYPRPPRGGRRTRQLILHRIL